MQAFSAASRCLRGSQKAAAKIKGRPSFDMLVAARKPSPRAPAKSPRTDAQAVRWLRTLCLSLPKTHEGLHFGDPSFDVGKRIFASCGGKDGALQIARELLGTRRLLARVVFSSREQVEETHARNPTASLTAEGQGGYIADDVLESLGRAPRP